MEIFVSSRNYSLVIDEEAILESSTEPVLTLLVNEHYVDFTKEVLPVMDASNEVFELSGTLTVSF